MKTGEIIGLVLLVLGIGWVWKKSKSATSDGSTTNGKKVGSYPQVQLDSPNLKVIFENQTMIKLQFAFPGFPLGESEIQIFEAISDGYGGWTTQPGFLGWEPFAYLYGTRVTSGGEQTITAFIPVPDVNKINKIYIGCPGGTSESAGAAIVWHPDWWLAAGGYAY